MGARRPGAPGAGAASLGARGGPGACRGRGGSPALAGGRGRAEARGGGAQGLGGLQGPWSLQRLGCAQGRGTSKRPRTWSPAPAPARPLEFSTEEDAPSPPSPDPGAQVSPSCSTGGGGDGSGFLGTRVRRLAIRSRAGCNGTWARSVAGGVRVGDASAGGEGCSLTLTGSPDSLQRLSLTATSRHGTGRAEGGASAGRGGAGFAGERHPGTRARRCTRSPTGVRRELGASSLPVPSAYGAPGRGRQTSGRRRRHPSCHVTEGRPAGGRLLGGGNGPNGWTCHRIARLLWTLCQYGKARACPH